MLKKKNTMKYHFLLCIAAGLCFWCEGEVAIGPQLSGEGGQMIPDLGVVSILIEKVRWKIMKK